MFWISCIRCWIVLLLSNKKDNDNNDSNDDSNNDSNNDSNDDSNDDNDDDNEGFQALLSALGRFKSELRESNNLCYHSLRLPVRLYFSSPVKPVAMVVNASLAVSMTPISFWLYGKA